MAAPEPPSIIDLVRSGVLDADLGALVWLLVEGGIPVIAAVPAGRTAAGGDLVAGIVCSVHSDVETESVARSLTPVTATNVIRGRALGGVIEADSLLDVRARLGSGPMPLTPDQLTFLGCVLVLEPVASAEGPLRVSAAHYIRPLARDAHGHPQRLDPAVLATWDGVAGRYEHFAWGVLPEIAARLGRRIGDLEADVHHRRDDLAALVATTISGLADMRRLVAGYRADSRPAHDPSH